MRNNIVKNILIFLLVFLIISGVFSLLKTPDNKPEKISFNQLIAEINGEQIKNISVSDNRIDITLNDEKKQFTYKESSEGLTTIFKNYNLDAEKLNKINLQIENTSKGIWLSVVLAILPFILIIAFLFFMTRQLRGAGNQVFRFGESQAREISTEDKKKKLTFKNVAGVKEAKQELQEIVEFLKHPKKFIVLGAKIPKGVLLVGQPGTGKTLLARATAGEANVPFFHISGSEFVEMFVGVGAARVRDLFKKAKKSLPCIIFIDELDAVGRQRGAGLGGSHDEREQTLNQILVEMDGFEPNLGLVILAATNRPDILDKALLRPGRFDRLVILDLPDIRGREEILKIHCQGKPLAEKVSLKKVAERTVGFSGADLANLTNEAAIFAARKNKTLIEESDLLESIEKVILGPERKSHVLSEKEKKISAYHEAGHALVAAALPETDPVHKISIVSRGRAAGYTLKMPETEKYLRFKSEYLDNLSALLAGYAAESAIFNDVTTGASNDLQEATKLAKKLVTEYGMSAKLGTRTFGLKEELIFLGRGISEQKDYSEKTAEIIDGEVSNFIDSCYNKAKEIIQKKRNKLDQITNLLLEKESLESDEFEAIFKEDKKIC